MPDVIVIGGGPAGSAAAIRLARRGMKVRLFEKAHFPRPKLCGGFLSPECLADLEDLDVLDDLRRAGASTIRRTLVSSPWGLSVEAPLPSAGLSISRETLDHILLQRAREAGVEVSEGTDGFRAALNTPWTVVAAGRTAGSQEKHFPYYGIQAVFDDMPDLADQVELDLFPGGYVGLARQGERVNVCALAVKDRVRDDGPDLDQVLASWTRQNPLLKARLRTARRVSAWHAVGPVQMGFRRLAEPGRLFVGDAACVVDPFVGEGIAMSLQGAALGDAAIGRGSEIEAHYAGAWHRRFDRGLRWGRSLRWIFQRAGLQDLGVAGLSGFPQMLSWLTVKTRPAQVSNRI
jgi:flavin-dependent dehydrogenase